MLLTILVIVYVIACLFLILIVLLQAGKGGGMGSAFGGGGSSASSVFGGRGAATFMSKMTWVMAMLFIVLSVGISLNIASRKVSVDPNAAQDEPADNGANSGDSGSPSK